MRRATGANETDDGLGAPIMQAPDRPEGGRVRTSISAYPPGAEKEAKECKCLL
ncbi:hypothetical protein GCM10009675_20830 [Prauserella alba]|uniref:Uncharacterized protein n=1 Tax=Prauserella alba TaxID=176898 RepID=A0ABP4FY83_9PSEU